MKNMMKNTLRPASIALGLGLMLTTLCQAQQWSGEQNLGGNLLGGPGVGLIPNAGSDPQSTRIVDLLQVFYEGGDQGLWTRWRNSDVNSGVSWSRQEQGLGGQLFSLTCADVTNSSCWGNNATPVATKIPDPADGLGPGHLEVFYRGSDNHLHARLRPPDGNWGPDQDLGGQLSSDPSVALVPGTEQIEVFYRGADGRLKTQWGDLNSWVYETDMGGQLFGPTCTDVTNDSCYGAYATPATIQLPGTNDLEVFYRGPDNTLRARLRDDTGTWGGNRTWEDNSAAIPQWRRYRARTQ
jgi:hypothetical protein